jgi:sn-glycerol 3-phosphate transport system ATP-binding protein
MARLTLRDVSKRFGEETVLHAASIDVADGEFLVLVGPSGCGKSTLLRIVAGLIEPTSGEIAIDGRVVNDLEPRERDVAMVFQNYALYPHMSVRKNLAFPLKLAGVPAADVSRRVDETAALLGLGELLDRKPGTLSGGQMQRVALGRALIRSPRIFLFDEPLSNLDAKLRTEMRAEISRLHRRLGITTLYVTHDQAEAMTMGTRICVLEGGIVQQVGTPMEVFERPQTAFVASFIGSPPMNLVRGRAEGGRFRAGALDVPCPVGLEGELVLGVRPHQVSPGADFTLSIEHVEELGSQTLLHAEVDGQPFLISREGHAPVPSGQEVGVTLASEDLHWFDAQSGKRLSD